MKNYVLAGLVAAQMIVAAQPAAAARFEEGASVQTGTFAGARIRLSLGGKQQDRNLRAGLTLAPTLRSQAISGETRMRIGEGIALNFTPGAKPTLTLAGVRADTALGLQRNGNVNADKKLGVSTGGWVAIGVAAAAVVVGGLYLAADHIADCDEGECD